MLLPQKLVGSTNMCPHVLAAGQRLVCPFHRLIQNTQRLEERVFGVVALSAKLTRLLASERRGTNVPDPHLDASCLDLCADLFVFCFVCYFLFFVFV